MHPYALATEVARAITASLPAEAKLSVRDIATLLAPPPDANLGDLAFPCFRLAKALRHAPAKIAESLTTDLESSLGDGDDDGVIASVRAVGPYVNITLNITVAATFVLPGWARGETPTFEAREGAAREKVMVEYSQPNTHKAFHIGHMRNLCLGDCLVRLMRAVGDEVIAANYLGDVGAHIARCLWGMERLEGEAAKAPKEARGEWLGGLYTQASRDLKALEAAAVSGDEQAGLRLTAARDRMTEILKAIEDREPEMTALWTRTRQWSLDEFDEIYTWSDVRFDRVFYESEVDEPGLALVDDFLARGVFKESDGAIGIDNPEIKHMPFFMLRKRDGTGLYATKDLALARMKFEEFAIDRSLYVVDARQSDHFRHVFLTLEKMGFSQAKKCVHVAYEMVEGPNGPFASREGDAILFRSLRESLHDAALDERQLGKYVGEWTEAEIEETARQLSLGAIKYGMLNRDVNQKIVFNMKEWIEPTGNTGTYLQYAAARTLSVLRKAEQEHQKTLGAATIDVEAPTLGPDALPTASERGLMLAIVGLPSALEQAAEQLRPTLLCAALHRLAHAYNRFQNDRDCNVIHSEGDVLQGRLLLVSAARGALVWGLDALGIPAPTRI